MTFARNLTYRFMELSYVMRLEIASDMGFHPPEDVEDVNIWILTKAKESNRLDEIMQRVTKAHEELKT